MALRKTIALPIGLSVVDAYHRVEYAEVSKDQLRFQVRAYASVDFPACHDARYVCPYLLDGANPLIQAYEYLKSLPEYAGAVDC
ncbi:hypothetical protein [Pseudogulbenkiania sp. MAI-1]|uniref:hypothetical protein n=1 Tax=Pseudogulbenkiania sp. MAI-1 TaxID=990370 RepID=UPI00056CF752|nr:hypothetical protein [Pseudogulbenkiania sp. MAI-1]